MKKEQILIVGASGHAKVIIDIIEKEGKYDIAGLIDGNKKVGDELLGYKILGNESHIPELIKTGLEFSVIIAIGDNWTRHLVKEKIKETTPNVKFASAIHPSAQLAKGVKIGKGAVIMAGAVINSDTEIGDFTIVNTNASIDHDGHMLPFSSLAPGVTVGGNVTIGSFSAVSIGAVVKHKILIGDHSVIGAGSVLLSDCENNSIMYGVPAKKIRTRDIGEKYL